MRLNVAYPVLTALLLTLAPAGCRQEPLPDAGDVIRFTVRAAEVSSALTKADPTLPSVTPPGNSLEVPNVTVPVWGTYKVGSNAAAEVFKNPPLPLTCSNDGNSLSWDYPSNVRYYWNRSASYQFRSVFTDNHASYTGDNDQITVTYAGYPDDYDLMVAASSVASGDTQAADLLFRHACSAVRFFCVDPSWSSTQTDPNYSIMRFELKHFPTSGTLVFNGTSTTDLSVPVSGWTPGPAVDDVFALPAASLPWGVPSNTGTAESAGLTTWFYFVPQSLPAAAEVSFSIRVENTGQIIDVTRKLQDITDSWTAGKIYNYFIVIQPTSIQFDVTWTDWTATTPTELTE